MASEVMLAVGEGGRVSGATASDAELLASLAGATYRAVLTQPRGRSLSQMGLYWAMCGLIADNHPADLSKDEVSDVLKIECGHVRVWQDAKGVYRRTPKSIAFNAMSPADFRQFLDLALIKASGLFGEGLTDAVRRELESMGAIPANDASEAA